MSDDLLDLLPGGRLILRAAARRVLGLMDDFSEEQVASTGWTGREIDALVDLAQARIDGVPYGDWPPEDEEAV